MRKTLLGFFIVSLGWCVFSSTLGDIPEAHAQRKRGTVIRLSDFKIVGRIQKPQAFYVLHRAPLNYKSLNFKESFVKKVINAVKKSPF